jgi:hypothetical protein
MSTSAAATYTFLSRLVAIHDLVLFFVVALVIVIVVLIAMVVVL